MTIHARIAAYAHNVIAQRISIGWILDAIASNTCITDWAPNILARVNWNWVLHTLTIFAGITYIASYGKASVDRNAIAINTSCIDRAEYNNASIERWRWILSYTSSIQTCLRRITSSGRTWVMRVNRYTYTLNTIRWVWTMNCGTARIVRVRDTFTS
jgi:hypothetical protein